MREIFSQIRNTCPICKQGFGVFYLPYSDDDREKSKEFKLFQIVRNLVYGIKKEGSLKQLNTYFAACGFIADSTDQPRWNTKTKVDFQCRVGVHFVDPNLVVVKPDGSVAFSYRSIAFKNLEHIERCNYISQAYGIMVDFWNATHKEKITGSTKAATTAEEELIEMVKQAMRS